MTAPLPSQHHLFDLPTDVTYLNCAYFSPKPLPVREAGLAAVEAAAAPWGTGPADFFEPGERLREAFAGLIGGDADGVAFVPSASYGMGIAAASVPVGPGRTVVVVPEEFPSDVYPWGAVIAEAGRRHRDHLEPRLRHLDRSGGLLHRRAHRRRRRAPLPLDRREGVRSDRHR